MGWLALTQMAYGFWLIGPEQYLRQLDYCQDLLVRITATANKGE